MGQESGIKAARKKSRIDSTAHRIGAGDAALRWSWRKQYLLPRSRHYPPRFSYGMDKEPHTFARIANIHRREAVYVDLRKPILIVVELGTYGYLSDRRGEREQVT